MKTLTFSFDPQTGKRFITNAQADEFKDQTTQVWYESAPLGEIEKPDLEFYLIPSSEAARFNFELEARVDDNGLIDKVNIVRI